MVPARFSALVAGFDGLGLEPGDHLVTVLQNRWEAATHPLGLPVRRHRYHAAELARQGRRDRLLPRECRGQSRGLRRRLGRGRVAGSAAAERAAHLARCGGRAATSSSRPWSSATRAMPMPRAGADAWSLMLYTSGTTAKAERRAAPPPRRTRRGGRPCRAKSLSATASARSASCRSITRWACARCSRCR